MSEIIKKVVSIVLLAIFLLSTTGVFFIVNHCEAKHTNVVSLKENTNCCEPVAEKSCCSGNKKLLQEEPRSSGSFPVFQTSKCCTSASLYKKLNSVFLQEKCCSAFIKMLSGHFCILNTQILSSLQPFRLFNDTGPPVIKAASDLLIKTSCLLL